MAQQDEFDAKANATVMSTLSRVSPREGVDAAESYGAMLTAVAAALRAEHTRGQQEGRAEILLADTRGMAYVPLESHEAMVAAAHTRGQIEALSWLAGKIAAGEFTETFSDPFPSYDTAVREIGDALDARIAELRKDR